MPEVFLWGWDSVNKQNVRVLVNSSGEVQTVAVIDKLDDIGDVDVATPTDLYILYWNATNSAWECRAFTDWDVTGMSGLLADDQHVLDSEVIAAVGTITITFIIDGGGSAITTGQKGHLEIPFGCTINAWTLMADVAGAIVIDIWKDTYANFPPADADAMPGAGKEPTIAATNQKAQDTDVTDWTHYTIAAGDILAFNVDSCTTITRVTLSLKCTKT